MRIQYQFKRFYNFSVKYLLQQLIIFRLIHRLDFLKAA